jgi:carbamoyl-phosphate synthase small subunit
MRPAVLVLEDGAIFEGVGFGATSAALGEVVFNTGMTGYQEVLTDPSYEGQIVVMTYPHIGNYGINDEDVQSARPRVSGFVVRDVPAAWSSWRGKQGLEEYLSEWGIPGIGEIDTRRLTRHIRDKGAMRGGFSIGELDAESLLDRVRSVPSMVGSDLVPKVTTGEPYEWKSDGKTRFRVAAYDFGIKWNSLRLLGEQGCSTTVYSAFASAEEVLGSKPDGVFLSNGPGDPAAVRYGIETVRRLIGKIPIFGICLGHQLLGLAAGLATYKLRFGHHGINHPVARLSDGSIEITTQNHGFAVSADAFGFEPPDRPGAALPEGLGGNSQFGRLELTHLNLNDYTVEGLRFLDEPAFCVQYHPEAGPGPHDSRYLFAEFCSLMEEARYGAR